jgi:hypothetical protein|tara:strand:+ start:2365 stop:2535 length:171 start_codon:yes stop_codon:yes gene_type:complete
MDLIEVVVGIIIVLFFAYIAIIGSIVNAVTKREIRRLNEAGTHDYYGNKLSGDDDV